MADLTSDPRLSRESARILKLLGHPTRLQIVAVLSHVGEAHVTGLMGCLELPQAVVSQQLGLLRGRGLVSSQYRDGYVWYRLVDPRLARIIRCIEEDEQG